MSKSHTVIHSVVEFPSEWMFQIVVSWLIIDGPYFILYLGYLLADPCWLHDEYYSNSDDGVLIKTNDLIVICWPEFCGNQQSAPDCCYRSWSNYKLLGNVLLQVLITKPFMFGKIALSFLEGVHRKITCTFDLFSKVVEVFSHFLGDQIGWTRRQRLPTKRMSLHLPVELQPLGPIPCCGALALEIDFLELERVTREYL